MGYFFFGAILVFGCIILVLRGRKWGKGDKNGSDGGGFFFGDSGSSDDASGDGGGDGGGGGGGD